MALTTPSDHVGGSDSRWRHWGKTIRSNKDIDLTKAGGYSLTGPFVHFDKTLVLAPGEYLVCASERGSRNHHKYEFQLVEGGHEACHPVPMKTISALIEARMDHVSEPQRAAARNSTLYAFALYVSLRLTEPLIDRAPLIEAARKALASLTRQERDTLIAEIQASAAPDERHLDLSVNPLSIVSSSEADRRPIRL